MQRSFLLAASALAIGVSGAQTAFAQSTGTVDFEQPIIVTGTAVRSVAGVETPDTPKARQVLDQSVISRQTPGQTINDIINLIPGVSFQNNDPFGSAGGKLFIRGFDNSRISQTFDGLPLNDTGNYALYSNQQLDPELIEQVNVNLGTTDVDSPTASASGSTVNYRTRNPLEQFGARIVGSVGDFDFQRIFAEVDTGVLTASGLRAFISASSATNDTIYGGIGKIDKKQINAKIYQPLGDNGDFISVAGHYNENRNNFFGSVPLWDRNYGARVVSGGSANRFPLTGDERFYTVPSCYIAPGIRGVADAASGCGSDFEFRYNPSNTGNIRVNSRFTLADGLVLTVDPSFQYTKANGGGTVVGSEGTAKINGVSGLTGFMNGNYYFGHDLNNDGDSLDLVRLLAPSQTQTYRLGVITSLRYDIDANNTVRVAYTYDRGRHRQTGEVGYIRADGFAADVFPVNDPLVDAAGNVLQKRDRLSYAILHQISGEYRGQFMNDALTITAGLRAPFFKRNLTNYCFATNAGGGLACPATDAASTAFAAANPTAATPQQRVFNYNRVLPNVGFTYKLAPETSVFANYSRGLQVPGTDNLYNSFFFTTGTDAAKPQPETTDNFDVGLRMRSGKVMAQVSAWYTIYQNRLAQAYDRDLSASIYRNLGRVDKYGFDGSIAWAPVKEVSLYVFGSYLHSKIRDNVDAGVSCAQSNVDYGTLGCTSVGQVAYYQTAGKRESAAPVYTFGGRAEGTLGPVSLGIQAKRTGPRYVNDQNLPFYVTAAGAPLQIFGAKAPAYTLVDLDAKLSLAPLGLGDRTYLQLNVTNLFDERYVGGFDGTFISQTGSATSPITYGQIGAPRTFIGTISFGF
ncbi:TonB-dependent receptor [Novosphingobium sp. KCTC 2891]|uniref:TonB-dependent receptor n=1 Tax=Novosphingobium sp. KCTC 2891 TaxID=2989730 RepID=UPI00222209CD|nr:TonB-dependent receptor [Novosphingobium sp. KCTC 2891]MCW1382956.1 TonB-dependent receptor [Novosphingobium sp. KCTC 2891]